jgi:hypothetical protein
VLTTLYAEHVPGGVFCHIPLPLHMHIHTHSNCILTMDKGISLSMNIFLPGLFTA